MDVVFTLADRITVLHYGEVLAEGTADEVRADPRVYDVYLGVRPWRLSGSATSDRRPVPARERPPPPAPGRLEA